MKDEQTRTRFETLLLPLMKDAYNLTRWLMKNQEDAEDMVQESYLRAYRFFGTFHEGTNYRAWFLRIVRNTCYTALGDHDLKQKQVPLDSEADEIEDAPLPSVSLSKKATVDRCERQCGLASRFSRSGGSSGTRGFTRQGNLRGAEFLWYGDVASGTCPASAHLLLSDRKQHDQL